MWFGLGWGGLLLFVGLKSRFALGRELRIPREAWPLGGSIEQQFLKCRPKCHTCPSCSSNLRLLSAVVLMLSAVALISVQGYAPSASVVPAVSASRSAARFMRMSAPESGTFSEDLGIPCEGDCEAVYSKLPSSVKPGVVTGQALVDLLDYAKARRPDQPAHHTLRMLRFAAHSAALGVLPPTALCCPPTVSALAVRRRRASRSPRLTASRPRRSTRASRPLARTTRRS